MVRSSVVSSNPAGGYFVVFFLINDSFLAFVTSSSLSVVGTKQSSHHLLPVPYSRRRMARLSVLSQGRLQLWVSRTDGKELKPLSSTALK